MLTGNLVDGSTSEKPEVSKAEGPDETEGGYFDLELAPDSLANVPFAQGQLTIWKHAKQNKFYVRPLAYLLEETARCRYNNLTGNCSLLSNSLV